MNNEIIKVQVQKVQQGDLEVSYVLWEELGPIWRKWRKNVYLEGMDKEDLAQQSYLILLEALEKYESGLDMSFLAFYKIRLHIWQSRQLKKAKFQMVQVDTLTESCQGMVDQTNLSQEVEQSVILETVLEAIHEFNPEQQRILLLTLVEGLDNVQVAKLMGTTPGAICKKKKRLIMRLRKQLTPLY